MSERSVTVVESGNGPYGQFITSGRHVLGADEPVELGGQDTGPDPFELPPEAVVKKLVHALESPRPRARYYVTTPTYLMGGLRRLLPTRALDWLIAKG